MTVMVSGFTVDHLYAITVCVLENPACFMLRFHSEGVRSETEATMSFPHCLFLHWFNSTIWQCLCVRWNRKLSFLPLILKQYFLLSCYCCLQYWWFLTQISFFLQCDCKSKQYKAERRSCNSLVWYSLQASLIKDLQNIKFGLFLISLRFKLLFVGLCHFA